MLELKNIKKEYPAGDGVINALKGVNLKFRESEFVSILGPSGCGKTTMLNIIGGLDQYTEGDLVINGRSTKDFKDRNWDSYRNQSIGFVFQSYNLIPHQTVLHNVELALTLCGVSKEERQNRAKKALEEVGLSDQMNKNPNKLSGGQMQRVAIARALVNNPDIILADEPTGALDTTTSVQVMEILKEISKNKLVIMVTHNASLADQYSSRIIQVLDGEIIGDSNPVTDEEYETSKVISKMNYEKESKTKKPSMSTMTSFSLSLKNLLTKKGRTILTSFAGSIGIIGIALILSLSQGFTSYINFVQENTLSSYPLTIESSVRDLSSIVETIIDSQDKEVTHELDGVYSNPITYDLINSLGNLETTDNDLKSFKGYLDSEIADEESDSGLNNAISGIKYSYDLDLLTYTKGEDGTIIRSDPTELLNNLIMNSLGQDISPTTNPASNMMSPGMSSMFTPGFGMGLWEEMLSGDNNKPINDLMEKQYDLVYGSWPNSYNEIVLVLDANNQLDDLSLYALGLIPEEEMNMLMKAFMNSDTIDTEVKKWSYEEICDKEFRVVLNSNRYSLDSNTGNYTDLSSTETGMSYLYDNGIDLKVTGIIRPDEDAMATMMLGSIGYTSQLTEYVIEHSNTTEAVKAQLGDKTKDIFTGLSFKTDGAELTNEAKSNYFIEYAKSLSVSDKATLYMSIMSIPTDEYITSVLDQFMLGKTRKDIEGELINRFSQETGMDVASIQEYLNAMDDTQLFEYVRTALAQQLTEQYSEGIAQQLTSMTSEDLAAAFDAELHTYSEEQRAEYYNDFMPPVYSDSTLEDNLKLLGYVDIDTPFTISLYASSFKEKDIIIDAIASYNGSVDEIERITYTDFVGLIMSSITTIIDTITYVLIAFVSISLIVSSIMIGIITLISVQERTKEIGILRAIGASKRDVSSLFNAETIIIGFSAGLLGVIVTVLLCIPINMIIHRLTGIMGLNAYLPMSAAVALVLISVILTLFSGIIPSRSAAKKDPVVALRTE